MITENDLKAMPFAEFAALPGAASLDLWFAANPAATVVARLFLGCGHFLWRDDAGGILEEFDINWVGDPGFLWD